LEKVGGWRWFFDGENVVKWVVKRGALEAVFQQRKTRHVFELYFWLSAMRSE
jgi:hypothetical protein